MNIMKNIPEIGNSEEMNIVIKNEKTRRSGVGKLMQRRPCLTLHGF
jgi:hypothetical protein